MKMMKKIKKSKTCKAQKITKGEYMVKVKNMMEKGLSAVRDLSDFFKEVARNRKQKKALRTDEDEKLLPKARTFNGIPLRDYCWLRDEIFRTEQERGRHEADNFSCRIVMLLSFAFLAAGLVSIYINIITGTASFLAFLGLYQEMDLLEHSGRDEFVMSFPEYGIWNSGELKDFKYNFENIFKAFNYRGERAQGKEFEKIFKINGIDYEEFTYGSNLKKTSLLLNIFYGLNDWETTDEMLYDMRKGEFSAEELLRRKNELCSFERNFVSKGRMKFRKTRKDRELERTEIEGKTYWQDEKGFIKIREEFSELTKFSEKDIRGLLKGVLPSVENIKVFDGERWLEKGYVLLEGEGRRKHMMFFKQEWEKLDKEDVEEEEG